MGAPDTTTTGVFVSVATNCRDTERQRFGETRQSLSTAYVLAGAVRVAPRNDLASAQGPRERYVQVTGVNVVRLTVLDTTRDLRALCASGSSHGEGPSWTHR
jgi:hypothetical protein